MSKNIVHLYDQAVTFSGVTRYLQIITRSDFHNHFIISIRADEVKKKFDAQGVLFYSNVLFRFPLIALIYLIYFVKKNKIDIIHSHHRYFDTIVWICNKILRITTLTTVHSIVYNKKNLSYKSQILIAVSKSVEDHLIEYFGISKYRINQIYNPVNLDLLKTTTSQEKIYRELNIDTDKFIIGYFGNFSKKEKGIDVLLKAISIIDKSNELDYQLILIGDGEDRNYIENFLKSNSINVLLLKSRINIQNYLQVLNCFILPSRVDPFPYVMLECAAMKVPFIGSTVDGISEFIIDNETGILFEKGESEDLAQKVLLLADNPPLSKKLTDNNYERILQFNEQSKQRLSKIYERV